MQSKSVLKRLLLSEMVLIFTMTNEQIGVLLVFFSLLSLTAVRWPPVMDLLSCTDHSDFCTTVDLDA